MEGSVTHRKVDFVIYGENGNESLKVRIGSATWNL